MRPFAVVCSNSTKVLEDGRVVRCRQYPWGCVNIDDETHCDFVKLRTVLFKTDLYTLREITHNLLYEHYRTERLSSRADNVLLAESQESSNVGRSDMDASYTTSNYNSQSQLGASQ